MAIYSRKARRRRCRRSLPAQPRRFRFFTWASFSGTRLYMLDAADGACNAGRADQIWKTNGEDMTWHAPKFTDVSCGMEITRYAPADGDEPILF
jgi:coenzyme PQQ precursor peptide PqqA